MTPMTMTLRSPSTPSISVRSRETIVVSTSEEIPEPDTHERMNRVVMVCHGPRWRWGDDTQRLLPTPPVPYS
jgi:hypothetical protein